MRPFLILSFCTTILLSACDSSRWEIPSEAMNVEQSWSRFDLSLIDYAKKDLDANAIQEWENEYPQFLPLYTEGIMRFGPLSSKEVQLTFSNFLKDKDVNNLLKKVGETYPKGTLEEEKKTLEKAFARYTFHFPERRVPGVLTFSSALTYATVADDSLLGIGLDMYLGSDYEVYAQAGIPKYKFKHFERPYIPGDAMRAWLSTEFPSVGGKNLLEQMVYQGKLTYLLTAFLPEIEEHLLVDYTPEEYQWCEENEAEIWFHFIEMELLHTLENHQIRKYLGEAPFIAGFPEGSPGRVGQWVGFQIVKAYMENHPKSSLKELMEIKNADLILQDSNYKPRR